MDDHTRQTTDTPGSNPFAMIHKIVDEDGINIIPKKASKRPLATLTVWKMVTQQINNFS